MAIKQHIIKYGTPEWYAFRNNNGLGGSDVPTVMKLNPYQSGIRLFYEKLGEVDNRMETNQFMFWGQQNEDAIADVWQYWDGTEEGFIHNKENDIVIRKSHRVNGYSVNDKFPWLFGSYDRVMNVKGGFRMDNDDPTQKRVSILKPSPLEIKTIDGWAAKQWENEIPIYYIPQIETYKIILETKYAELAVLKSGNRFEVYPMPYREDLRGIILEKTKKWWDDVLKARKIIKERNQGMIEGKAYLVEAASMELMDLEPEPDSTADYEQFLSERARKTSEEMQAPKSLERMLMTDRFYRKYIKMLEEKMRLNKNTIIKMFDDESIERAICTEAGGYSQWILPKNAEKKRLYNQISWVPNKKQLEQQVKSLDIMSFINE